ncbi:MAG: methyltransferase domain-containing protein [Bacteroidetes bacterium]|nr:methyltransferase domain-containing protein [Bacteroidota bacterium]
MTTELFFEIHKDLPREGPGRNDYTRKAFLSIPRMNRPRILDVGCGPGTPTMELARLSDGKVTAIDLHQPYLDRLSKKAADAGLAEHVTVRNMSMFEMDFPEEFFDVIWAEGSIYIIGFERGLKEWRRFLKDGGSIAVHDVAWISPDPPREVFEYWSRLYPEIRSIPEHLDLITACGYELVEQFVLPENAWWDEYYGPLEARLEKLRDEYRENAKALQTIQEEQREVDMYRKYSNWYGAVFYVMKKA